MTYTADDVRGLTRGVYGETDDGGIIITPQAIADLINAAVAKALEPYQWQPIETAAYKCVGRALFYSPCYKESDPMQKRILDSQFSTGVTDATHWMPLPPAPNKEAQ